MARQGPSVGQTVSGRQRDKLGAAALGPPEIHHIVQWGQGRGCLDKVEDVVIEREALARPARDESGGLQATPQPPVEVKNMRIASSPLKVRTKHDKQTASVAREGHARPRRRRRAVRPRSVGCLHMAPHLHARARASCAYDSAQVGADGPVSERVGESECERKKEEGQKETDRKRDRECFCVPYTALHACGVIQHEYLGGEVKRM